MSVVDSGGASTPLIWLNQGHSTWNMLDSTQTGPQLIDTVDIDWEAFKTLFFAFFIIWCGNQEATGLLIDRSTVKYKLIYMDVKYMSIYLNCYMEIRNTPLFELKKKPTNSSSLKIKIRFLSFIWILDFWVGSKYQLLNSKVSCKSKRLVTLFYPNKHCYDAGWIAKIHTFQQAW